MKTQFEREAQLLCQLFGVGNPEAEQRMENAFNLSAAKAGLTPEEMKKKLEIPGALMEHLERRALQRMRNRTR